MSNAQGSAGRDGSGGSLEFDPIVNGVDFLDSAIAHLAESDDPRSLKYAVLRLQAAIEVLVKVRLQREGIKHIFEDPYSADQNKLRQGDFPQPSRSPRRSNGWPRSPTSNCQTLSAMP